MTDPELGLHHLGRSAAYREAYNKSSSKLATLAILFAVIYIPAIIMFGIWAGR